jgi:deoxycytidine triphosphate deaminase
MSIIFLEDKLANSKEDFEKFKKSYDSKIFIEKSERDKEVLLDAFSIDLTLGNAWNSNYSYNDKSLFQIEKGQIIIRSKQSVVVLVDEYIKVPNNKFGIVLSTGSLFLQKGVLIPSAKVEPGYSGRLKLRIVNTSSSKIVINVGEKLASVVFFATDNTPSHIEAIESESTNIPKISFWHKLRLAILSTPLATWISIGSLFAAVIIPFLTSK